MLLRLCSMVDSNTMVMRKRIQSIRIQESWSGSPADWAGSRSERLVTVLTFAYCAEHDAEPGVDIAASDGDFHCLCDVDVVLVSCWHAALGSSVRWWRSAHHSINCARFTL